MDVLEQLKQQLRDAQDRLHTERRILNEQYAVMLVLKTEEIADLQDQLQWSLKNEEQYKTAYQEKHDKLKTLMSQTEATLARISAQLDRMIGADGLVVDAVVEIEDAIEQLGSLIKPME